MRVFIALVVLALLSVHALAQSEAELNAGKTKLTISVKHGEDAGGDAQCEDCDKDENKSLLINLPPEPKAARGYVPKNDLPSNDQNSDVLGVVSAPVVTQPVIVAPVIGAQQPAGEACTDNCDAELAPPPVQIAGPTVASKVLGKEIFDDDAYIPVPDTQVEAKPAMVSVPEHLRDLPPPDGGPTKRCEGDECGDDSSSSSAASHADSLRHDLAARQVDHDSHEIALAREKARRARQDEEDRREEEFQAERRKWRKEALEEEEEEERRRKQASIADADRFKEKLPEHRIPATPVEPADNAPDLAIAETDTCGTPPCQKVVVAVCEAPPCAPSPPCGCIGTPSCACAPPLVATPPPCGCIGTIPCDCQPQCSGDDEECKMMTRAEQEAKMKEAADARASEEKIKQRTRMEEELRKHQENIDQVGRMTRGLRYQYGILRKQHERIKQQMLAAKIALKNLGPDPFKGTEYDIEGPEPKAWDDLGLDDSEDDADGTIPERPLTNLDTVVKVVKRGVYGMPPQQAAKLLAARDIQAAMNASELVASATTSETMKKQQQLAEMITTTAVRNADSTLGVKSDSQASAVLEKLKATLAADASQATGGNPSDEQVKKIASILATMDPSKSSRQILKELDDRSRAVQKQEEDDQMSFDWQQSLFKLNKMVQSFGKQHTYQKNTLDTSQINNRIKVCHFLNEWGVLDDYCKWLLYDAFKVHLAPPKPKPAAPQPEPKKPEEKKPEPAPAAPAPPPPPPPPPPQDDTNYLPATYGASFGWAHALPKKPFPI